MSTSKLKPLLNNLSQSIIKKMNINIPKDMISIDIKKENPNSCDEYKVVFEEVFSFYFVNENTNLVKKAYFDCTKLTSIGYYENGIGEFANADVSDIEELKAEDVSLPNFALELKNSSMFIEARSIKINDKKFKVGYPNI
ncbi:hypothetical protein [Caminicella sporogenes]|uniref:YxiG family protein n=1 Tax=Caminicella sporogenes TaxID=166485 RepID=UPI0025403690|nr:hypothetical protein [Caminicella sporogenes]WIF95939.1 hypothetical protein QNI18_04855 [Caminicella sporogenes]